MKIEKKILVCGASISGTAIAFWLERSGFQVVIVEKFESFRDGGQNVDIKGYGQDVLKLMGIDQEVDSKNTGELGLKYLNENGKTISTFPKGTAGGLTSSYEILRGDLARILYEKTAQKCDYRFGTFVKNFSAHEDGITITFNNGSVEEFEMLICADGIGSTTRDMVMPEYIHFNYLGAYMSFFTIPKTSEDDLWAKAYQTKGAMVFLRPGHENETTVLISFRKEKVDPVLLTITEQKARLKAVLSGKGGIADRIVQNLDGVKDMYFGPMSQVKASKWSKGKVVLLGDAAHAPTPFTGMGTALSLIGAYILAGEIRQNSSIQAACQAYEKIFKPFVELAQQQMSPGIMRRIHPTSKFGITIARMISKILASRFVQKQLRLKPEKEAKEGQFVLPVYQNLVNDNNK